MKKSLLQQLIREEIGKTLNESASPINHKVSGEYIVLQFNNESECQSAKQYYSQLHVRTSPDKKGLLLPLISVARFLVNQLQNKSYNPE
jgi:hypothetical protein